MWLIYDLLINLYGGAIRMAALFNPKAHAWIIGRKGLFAKIESSVSGPQSNESHQKSTADDRRPAIIWFHCASLGEFEQGRPVIEAIRKKHTDWKILLTFFSPSGYDVRKNYEGADWVFYLPLDTPKNAGKFVNLVNPSLAVFVKYEFWFRYLDALYRHDIPVYVISANFRPNHHFFSWYGSWARKQLHKVTWLFVQHENSAFLLKKYGIDRVMVSGDTRFDRVAAVASQAKVFRLAEKFARQMPVFLAGSTWPADEELILQLIETQGDRMKFIIAPHEVGEQRLKALQSSVVSRQSSVVSCQSSVVSRQSSVVSRQSSVDNDDSEFLINSTELNPQNTSTGTRNPETGTILFSELTEENASASRVLIVDGIGYLSHLYQYATIAYIGGGFGTGIHNILEAAAFGKPVIFGPKYQKFREASDLIDLKGAFTVNSFRQLNDRTVELMDHAGFYAETALICRKYVEDHCGATSIIVETLMKK